MNVANTEPRTWNYKLLVLALVAGVWLQVQLLPVYSGHASDVFLSVQVFKAALLFDGFVVLRILVAALKRERNRRWILYSFLCLTSFLWVAILAAVIAMFVGF